MHQGDTTTMPGRNREGKPYVNLEPSAGLQKRPPSGQRGALLHAVARVVAAAGRQVLQRDCGAHALQLGHLSHVSCNL